MILPYYINIIAEDISIRNFQNDDIIADNNDDDGEDSVEAPPFSPLSEADLTTEDESVEEEPGNSHRVMTYWKFFCLFLGYWGERITA